MATFSLSTTTVRIPAVLLDQLQRKLPSRARNATIRSIVNSYCSRQERPAPLPALPLTKRGKRLSDRRRLAVALGSKSCPNPISIGVPKRELSTWRRYTRQVGLSSLSCLVSHALAAHLQTQPELPVDASLFTQPVTHGKKQECCSPSTPAPQVPPSSDGSTGKS